jgi:hypothetical protein
MLTQSLSWRYFPLSLLLSGCSYDGHSRYAYYGNHIKTPITANSDFSYPEILQPMQYYYMASKSASSKDGDIYQMSRNGPDGKYLINRYPRQGQELKTDIWHLTGLKPKLDKTETLLGVWQSIYSPCIVVVVSGMKSQSTGYKVRSFERKGCKIPKHQNYYVNVESQNKFINFAILYDPHGLPAYEILERIGDKGSYRVYRVEADPVLN